MLKSIDSSEDKMIDCPVCEEPRLFMATVEPKGYSLCTICFHKIKLEEILEYDNGGIK